MTPEEFSADFLDHYNLLTAMMVSNISFDPAWRDVLVKMRETAGLCMLHLQADEDTTYH